MCFKPIYLFHSHISRKLVHSHCHSPAHHHIPPSSEDPFSSHHEAMINLYYQGLHAPPDGFLCADSEYLYPALYILNSDFPNGRQHIQIRRVGRRNFAAEAQVIRHLVKNTDFNVVSMDMAYPGTVHTSSDYKQDRHPAAQYRLMKANVDELGLIQVGFTLCDKSGNLATVDSTGQVVVWEFAIRDFDIVKQRYNEKSIRFLVRLGINLRFHREEGIHSHEFVQMLIDTGLVLNRDKEVRWITHCGAHDFGYLIKALTKKALPEKLQDFMKLVYFYFGRRQVDDIKFMMRFCYDPCNKNNVRKLSGSLVEVAAKLGMRRILGVGHPAGTGCFLTYQVFHQLRRLYSTDSGIEMRSAGNIHLLANY